MSADMASLCLLSMAIFYLLFTCYKPLFVENTNLWAFYHQLQKLVLANNLDRAIKLCNVEPHNLAAQMLKSLLLKANRVEQMEFEFRTALLEAEENRSRHVFHTYIAIGVALAAIAATFALMQGHESNDLVFYGILSLLVATACRVYVGYNTAHFYTDAKLALAKLRNLLWARSLTPADRRFSDGEVTTYPSPYKPFEADMDEWKYEDQQAFVKAVEEDIESEGEAKPSWF